MTEYVWYCRHCSTSIRTDDPPGTTCKCGKSQVDWIRANKITMAERVKTGNPYARIARK
jgi:ABC-type ATPase with predicted acetyltransferase domain